MPQVLCRRPAMATLFEFLLVGDDEEHLAAVGEAALDEVTRIEQMISMHDPTSELARVNREAYAKPVTVSADLIILLDDCRSYHEMTQGKFDPCHGCPVPYGQAVEVVLATRRVRFTHPETRIDLGGFGKGYALDWANDYLSNKVHPYLLHGGTSSVYAGGEWAVALRSPRDNQTVGTVMLHSESLSCSSDGRIGTVAIASLGSLAEVWSTAMLAIGTNEIENYYLENLESAALIDTEIHWLEGPNLWPRQPVAPSS